MPSSENLSSRRSCGMKLFTPIVVSVVGLQLFGRVCAAIGYDRKAKEYIVNLDLPPSERWADVIKDYQAEIKYIMKILNGTYSPMLNDAFSKIAKDIDKYVPYPYNEEIAGIAKLLDGVSVESILKANLYYELIPYHVGGETPNGDAALTGTSVVAEALNRLILHGKYRFWFTRAQKYYYYCRLPERWEY